MKYTAKLINVGLSTYILVPSNIRHLLKVESGDVLEVDILKINGKNPILTYRCKKCQHRFSSNDEYPECPGCFNTDLEVIEK